MDMNAIANREYKRIPPQNTRFPFLSVIFDNSFAVLKLSCSFPIFQLLQIIKILGFIKNKNPSLASSRLNQ